LCCGSYSGSTIPVKVKGVGGSGSLTGVVAVRGSLGDGNCCAIVTSGWGGLLGLRPNGELGNRLASDSDVPVAAAFP
jgi:hypothetical protein